jgi:hypothetical protein
MDTPRKYIVRLKAEQRDRLVDLTRTGSAPARKLSHARVLLLADADHADGQRPDTYIADALGMHVNGVAKIRKRFVLDGEAPALDRKRRQTPPVPPKVDGRVEAHLVAICCSDAPEGRTRWTLELLANELKRRGFVTSISLETVRKTLKKTSCSRGGSSAGASRNGRVRGS